MSKFVPVDNASIVLRSAVSYDWSMNTDDYDFENKLIRFSMKGIV